jgi:hypothetical protein
MEKRIASYTGVLLLTLSHQNLRPIGSGHLLMEN